MSARRPHRPREKRRFAAAAARRPAVLEGARPLDPDGPDLDVIASPDWREVASPDVVRGRFPPATVVRCDRAGPLSVIVTRHAADGYRLSISQRGRYPTRDEIASARCRLLPDVAWMAMDLPPKSDYVNLHRNVFRLVERPDPGT